MKKLAIPVEEGKLAGHFGHARQFYFYEIDENEVVNQYEATPPPHTPGALPAWLVENNVSDVIAGGIGPKAIDILNAANINTLTGIESVEIETVVNDFVKGTIKSGTNNCNH